MVVPVPFFVLTPFRKIGLVSFLLAFIAAGKNAIA